MYGSAPADVAWSAPCARAIASVNVHSSLATRCTAWHECVTLATGAWLLVSAKVLAGKRVTSFCSIKDDVTNAGAEFVDAEVVIDGNMITSRTPDDLPAFMRAIIASLETAKQAKQGAVAAKATTD